MTAQPARWDLTGTLRPWPGECASAWRRCLDTALSEPGVWQTVPRPGLPRLRAALAAHFGVAPERLTVTSGVRSSVPGLLHGVRHLVMERPTFAHVARLAQQSGVDVTVCPDPLARLGEPDGSRTLVWVTSPARNPDGWSLSRPEAETAAATCQRPDGPRLVVNQAYHWLHPDAPRPPSATLVGTLHKLVGGGVSLGWLAQPVGEPIVERPAAGGPPGPWQLAWARYIEEGGLDRLAARTLVPARQRCEEFLRRLTAAGVRTGHCGLSALLPLPDGVTEQAAVDTLREAGLAVSPGSAFLAETPSIRVSFTAVSDAAVEPCADAVARLLTSATSHLGGRSHAASRPRLG